MIKYNQIVKGCLKIKVAIMRMRGNQIDPTLLQEKCQSEILKDMNSVFAKFVFHLDQAPFIPLLSLKILGK